MTKWIFFYKRELLESLVLKINIAEMARFMRNIQWDVKIVNLKFSFGYTELHGDSTRHGQRGIHSDYHIIKEIGFDYCAQGLLVHPTEYWRIALELFEDCTLLGIGGLRIYY